MQATGRVSSADIGSARRTTIAADRPMELDRLEFACAPAQVRRAGAAYLHSTYFDTAALTLVTAGYSLRYRVSGTDASWTLSCPDGMEHRRSAPAGVDGVVPADLRALAGVALHDQPVTALLGVTRVDIRYEVRAVDGALLAEVVEDTVEAVHLLTGGHIGTWRRVQVDAAENGDAALARRIAQLLRSAG
ncbi:MAG: hypothetical protein LBQ06_05640 [Frankiaceae bacterium]|jgi:hypothetical protein|nr:hypothetical protein [Frankiaceae bacterium]